jgi:putative sigma-54 modulation protein
MDTIITARHFDLEEDTKQRIQDRLMELEDAHPRLTSAKVILDQQKSTSRAEILIHGRKIDVEAHAKAKDLDVAFTAAFEKADRQLNKHYDKIKDHHSKPVSQLEVEIEEELMNSPETV